MQRNDVIDEILFENIQFSCVDGTTASLPTLLKIMTSSFLFCNSLFFAEIGTRSVGHTFERSNNQISYKEDDGWHSMVLPPASYFGSVRHYSRILWGMLIQSSENEKKSLRKGALMMKKHDKKERERRRFLEGEEYKSQIHTYKCPTSNCFFFREGNTQKRS